MAYLLLFVFVFFGLCVRKTFAVRPLAAGGFFFAETGWEDDSDMKIAGGAPAGSSDISEEVTRELYFHKKNGNLKKARQIGVKIAEKIIEADRSGYDQKAGYDSARNQISLLLVFSAYRVVATYISSKLLQQIVINIFYDKLKVSLPVFYNDLGEEGAISFYYLCARRGGNIEKEVGRTFAMLMSKDGDPIIEQWGEALFYRFAAEIKNLIDSYEFKYQVTTDLI